MSPLVSVLEKVEAMPVGLDVPLAVETSSSLPLSVQPSDEVAWLCSHVAAGHRMRVQHHEGVVRGGHAVGVGDRAHVGIGVVIGGVPQSYKWCRRTGYRSRCRWWIR